MSEIIKIVVVGDPQIVTGSTGGGSGTITGGINGLTTSGNKIKLGGTLTETTTVNTNLNTLNFGTSGTTVTSPNARLQFAVASNRHNVIFQSVYNSSSFADFRTSAGSGNTFFTLQSTYTGGAVRKIDGNTLVNGLTVTDSSGKGLFYAGNYASTFEKRSLPDVSYVTGLTSSLLPSSTFITFSGNTNTALGNKLSISAFNTYSATTISLINSKLNVSNFNVYSGLTLLRLATIENNYITGSTSLGGNTILGTKSGKNLRFKGLVAGSNISLTPSTTGITISATGGGGSGTITGATNGLMLSGNGKRIGFGGILTGATVLVGSSANTLSFRFPLQTTPVSAFVIENTNLATGTGTQPVSPDLVIRSNGWKTNATAGSQPVEVKHRLAPVQGSASPSFNYSIYGSINNGGDTELLRLSSAGVVQFPQGTMGGPSGVNLNIQANATNFITLFGNAASRYYNANGHVFSTSSSPISTGSTLVDFQSSTLGVLMPRVTSVTSPANAMIVYSASTNNFKFREGGSWVTYLNRNIFATYTGTTAPATYLTKNVFNSYTGTTTGSQMLTRVVGSTSLLSSDLGKTIEVTGSTNRTITITASAVTSGFQCNINNLMASNTVTLQAGPGTTLQLTGTILATQYAGASIYVSGTNVRGFGNLS